MIDLHLSAFAPRWRFLYVVRIDAYHNYQPNICIPYNLDIVLLLFCVMLSPCIFVLFILPSDFALGQKRITDQLI